MDPRTNKPAWIAGTILVLAFAAVLLARLRDEEGARGSHEKADAPIPVDVAEIVRGPLTLRRTFSGTIEPEAHFTVAPKVSGRILRLHLDVSDRVTRGQTVAELEDDEFRQAVAEAEARQAVAEANRVQASSRLETSQRERTRARALHERGIASDSALDTAEAEFLATQAAAKVAEATLSREGAALAGATIRLGYARIQADWERGDDDRVVAERYVDEGDTVAANTPLLSIVELDPVLAVIQVTERDYPRLRMGQPATVHSDAFPGQVFTGTVARIAPVFRETSRQARIEINIPNPQHLLKPGMFARCTLELDRVADAVNVPELAITERRDEFGVFLLTQGGTAVSWCPVTPGLKDGDRVQLLDADLSGQVVTLGQQLIEDGSTVFIPAPLPAAAGGAAEP